MSRYEQYLKSKRKRFHKINKRPRLTPADVENDLSRQRGPLAGFKEVCIKRFHRVKPKYKS